MPITARLSSSGAKDAFFAPGYLRKVWLMSSLRLANTQQSATFYSSDFERTRIALTEFLCSMPYCPQNAAVSASAASQCQTSKDRPEAVSAALMCGRVRPGVLFMPRPCRRAGVAGKALQRSRAFPSPEHD